MATKGEPNLYVCVVNAMPPAPGSQASLREMNRLRVLDAVREHGALTQVEIVESTGLSAATVSNLVRELDQAGTVELAPSVRNGRRAVLVSLTAAEGLIAGMVFDDRDVRVAVAGGLGDILSETRLPLRADHAADEGLERGARLLADLVERTNHDADVVRSVVVGLPAPVDAVTGQTGSEGILPGWRGVGVAEVLESSVGAPVLVENTATLATVGELRAGALQGVRNGLYVRLGHAVGAGLVIDGEVFRGSSGTAGQLGHVTIDENGQVCRCGNRGCLDTVVGHSAIMRALEPRPGTLTLRDVIARCLEGDPACCRVLADAGRHIGVAVASVVNLLNPDLVLIGGPMARVGAVVMDPLREALELCAIPSAMHTLQVRESTLMDRAEILGAVMSAADLRDGLPDTSLVG